MHRPKNVGSGAEATVTPEGERCAELGCAGAGLGRAHGGSAKRLDDGGYISRRNAPNVHLSEGDLEGLLAADAILQGGGIAGDNDADLGDIEVDAPDAASEGPVPETIGVAQPLLIALVGFGAKAPGTLPEHALADEKAKPLESSSVRSLSAGDRRSGFSGWIMGRLMRVPFVEHPNPAPS